MIERRKHPRQQVERTVEIIPLGANWRPQRDLTVIGRCLNVGAEGMRLELDRDQSQSCEFNELLVAVPGEHQQLGYLGLKVAYRSGHGHTILGGHDDHIGGGVFDAGVVVPRYDMQAGKYVMPWPEELLRAWCNIGVLESFLLDRVDVCPRCEGIPTFRQGCRRCGSGRTQPRRLIHHYACAYVGGEDEFHRGQDGQLMCPKCRTQKLVVGTDFEYFTVQTCSDCHWEESELTPVAHCTACDYRFNAADAHSVDLLGYRRHVDRVHPLDLLAIS